MLSQHLFHFISLPSPQRMLHQGFPPKKGWKSLCVFLSCCYLCNRADYSPTAVGLFSHHGETFVLPRWDECTTTVGQPRRATQKRKPPLAKAANLFPSTCSPRLVKSTHLSPICRRREVRGKPPSYTPFILYKTTHSLHLWQYLTNYRKRQEHLPTKSNGAS